MVRRKHATPETERLSSGMYWLVASTLAIPPAMAVMLARFSEASTAIVGVYLALLVLLAVAETRYLKVLFRDLNREAEKDGEFTAIPSPLEMIVAAIVIAVTSIGSYLVYTLPSIAIMVAAFAALGVLIPLFGRALWWHSLAASAVSAAIIMTADYVLTRNKPPEVHNSFLFIVAWSLAIIFVILASTRVSLWSVWVALEQQRLRNAAGQLAIAEERLRISRDLHDIFGRTLTSINLKSELAAELIRAGRSSDAEAQIGEISEMARDAGSEVRAVVSGFRKVDLDAELQGAAATLRTAGIDVELHSDEVPSSVQEPLAWAVREAATNVLRHSAASHCTISLRLLEGSAQLRVKNDRPHDPQKSAGTGLVGLQERLAPVGGTVEHERTDDTFTLTVSIPTEVGHDR